MGQQSASAASRKGSSLTANGADATSVDVVLEVNRVWNRKDPQELGPLNEVGEVEVLNIVAGHNVWIDLHDELLPRL